MNVTKSGRGKLGPIPVRPNSIATSAYAHGNQELASEAKAGEIVSFALKGVAQYDMKSRRTTRAMVLSDTVCPDTIKFKAQIIVMMSPNKLYVNLIASVFCHMTSTPCALTAILAKIDKKNGEVLEASPEYLQQGDAALVELTPQTPCVIEQFSEFPTLGRIVIRNDPGHPEGKITLMVGIVKEIVKDIDHL